MASDGTHHCTINSRVIDIKLLPKQIFHPILNTAIIAKQYVWNGQAQSLLLSRQNLYHGIIEQPMKSVKYFGKWLICIDGIRPLQTWKNFGVE